MHWIVALAVMAIAAMPRAAAAQPVDEPLPKVVADISGVWGGIPSSAGWVPEVPVNTPIPNRAFGVGAALHVFPLRLGIATLGLGASVIRSKAKGNPAEVVISGSGATAVTGEDTLPVVTTRVTSLVPQLSMNFGHRSGWSYLSAGYGATRIESTAAALDELPAVSAPDGWNPALNFGGGARWFMKRRLAAGFDVRFVKLSSRATTATTVGAKRAQVVNLLVGISLQ